MRLLFQKYTKSRLVFNYLIFGIMLLYTFLNSAYITAAVRLKGSEHFTTTFKCLTFVSTDLSLQILHLVITGCQLRLVLVLDVLSSFGDHIGKGCWLGSNTPTSWIRRQNQRHHHIFHNTQRVCVLTNLGSFLHRFGARIVVEHVVRIEPVAVCLLTPSRQWQVAQHQ